MPLLNIAVTQSEPGVKPDRMADDIGWEAVTLKGELAHRASLISISLSSQPSLCDNASDRYGDAVKLFELSDGELHHIVCYSAV